VFLKLIISEKGQLDKEVSDRVYHLRRRLKTLTSNLSLNEKCHQEGESDRGSSQTLTSDVPNATTEALSNKQGIYV
jgi:hypothetical protein